MVLKRQTDSRYNKHFNRLFVVSRQAKYKLSEDVQLEGRPVNLKMARMWFYDKPTKLTRVSFIPCACKNCLRGDFRQCLNYQPIMRELSYGPKLRQAKPRVTKPRKEIQSTVNDSSSENQNDKSCTVSTFDEILETTQKPCIPVLRDETFTTSADNDDELDEIKILFPNLDHIPEPRGNSCFKPNKDYENADVNNIVWWKFQTLPNKKTLLLPPYYLAKISQKTDEFYKSLPEIMKILPNIQMNDDSKPFALLKNNPKTNIYEQVSKYQTQNS